MINSGKINIKITKLPPYDNTLKLYKSGRFSRIGLSYDDEWIGSFLFHS